MAVCRYLGPAEGGEHLIGRKLESVGGRKKDVAGQREKCLRLVVDAVIGLNREAGAGGAFVKRHDLLDRDRVARFGPRPSGGGGERHRRAIGGHGGEFGVLQPRVAGECVEIDLGIGQVAVELDMPGEKEERRQDGERRDRHGDLQPEDQARMAGERRYHRLRPHPPGSSRGC
jgi:hypothetical protein